MANTRQEKIRGTMKLIEKDTLVAEVERRQKIHFNDYHINGNNSPADYGACNALTQILAFIDTLEVKEVDLEEVHYKPLDEDFERDAVSFCLDTGLNTTPYIAKTIAKHFFELGLKSTERRII